MSSIPRNDQRLAFLQKEFPLTPYLEDFDEPEKDLFVAITHQKVSRIMNALENVDDEDLEFQEHTKGLTPLMACVILDDVSTAKYLVKRNVSVLQKDFSDWTVFHHAALKGNQAMLAILKSAEEVPDQNPEHLQNNCGLTYVMMEHLLKRTLPLPEQPVFNYFDETSQQVIHNASALKFSELTQTQFVQESLVTHEYLIDQWENFSGDDFNRSLFVCLKSYVEKNYTKYKAAPPAIYLKRSSLGWGVYADRDIQPGEIVVHYAGEYVGKDPESAYYAGHVDGKNFRNLGPLVNDGIPNLIPVHVIIDNLPTIVYVSISLIKKDSEIFSNYGFGHSVKKGPYTCKNLETLVLSLANQGGITNIFRSIENLLDFDEERYLHDFQKALSLAQVKSTFNYIFQTPSVLLDLVFHQSITSKDLKFFFYLPQFFVFNSYLNLSESPYLKTLLEVICNIAEDYEKKISYLSDSSLDSDVLLYGEIQAFFLSLSGEFDTVSRLLIYRYILELENVTHRKRWSSKNKQKYLDYTHVLFQVRQVSMDDSLDVHTQEERILEIIQKLPEDLKKSVVLNYIKNEDASVS